MIRTITVVPHMKETQRSVIAIRSNIAKTCHPTDYGFWVPGTLHHDVCVLSNKWMLLCVVTGLLYFTLVWCLLHSSSVVLTDSFFWFLLLRFCPANRSLLLHAPCNLKSNHKTITKKQNKKVFNTGTSFSRMVLCCLYQHYCIISVLSFW